MTDRDYAIVKLACAARMKEYSPELSDADCVKLATIAMDKQAQAQPNSTAPSIVPTPAQLANREKAKRYAAEKARVTKQHNEVKEIEGGTGSYPVDQLIPGVMRDAVKGIKGLFNKQPAPVAPALGKQGGTIREWWRNGANNPVNTSLNSATNAIKSVPSRLGRTRFAKGLQRAVGPTAEATTEGPR